MTSEVCNIYSLLLYYDIHLITCTFPNWKEWEMHGWSISHSSYRMSLSLLLYPLHGFQSLLSLTCVEVSLQSFHPSLVDTISPESWIQRKSTKSLDRTQWRNWDAKKIQLVVYSFHPQGILTAEFFWIIAHVSGEIMGECSFVKGRRCSYNWRITSENTYTNIELMTWEGGESPSQSSCVDWRWQF